MKRLGFFLQLTRHHVGEICRRRLLITIVLLLCIALPMCIGPAMQSMFSNGVSFSGIRLAVTSHGEGDAAGMVEQYAGEMSDINEYCKFYAMTKEKAEESLRKGDITAIVVLPERFLTGVMSGENPDVELIVSADRPMESMLTLWLGQSVTDILSEAQSGIYGVLDVCNDQLPEGKSRSKVTMEINLKYIGWTLGRGEIFTEHTFSAVQVLPIAVHYGLSLLAYLGLSLAPLFAALYLGDSLTYHRRLRCLGYGSIFNFGSNLAACTLVIFVVVIIPIGLIVKGSVLGTILAAVVFALFCALFGSLCCLITTSAANSGLMAFTVALLSLGASGGILPPSLLPETLRKCSWLSPVNWLRELAAATNKAFAADQRSMIAMICVMAVMAVVCCVLYHRRVAGQEVTT